MSEKHKEAVTIALMILACVITAASLRPGATSVGPVLPELMASLGVGGAMGGLLTALPGIAFAAFGLVSNRFTAWVGLIGAVLISVALSGIGLLSRALVPSWWFFLLFTTLALAGMAIGNVVLPALIKKEFSRHSTQMATAYIAFLAVGSTAPALLSPFLLRQGETILSPGQGWRLALGVWSLISFLALALWIPIWVRGRRATRKLPTPSVRTKAPSYPVWRSRTALYLMLFFGLQSMQAYVQFGWVPAAYRAGGLDAPQAGLMVGIIALGGVPGGLIMPSVVARSRPRTLEVWIVAFSLLLATGYLGIALAPTTLPWLWAVCLAIAGFCFPTSLALIITKTTDPHVTAAVSGFVQPVGYVLAALGPFLVGFALQMVGVWPPILFVLASMAIPLAITGVLAVRGSAVDQTVKPAPTPATTAL